ncbi:MAG TPA: GNAT family protein [Actinophytocola sp.]|jgi:RimJ/RimL family protein N-acetyltransferase|nr:GNAT family protein [Actinophytocola sp.]
MSAREVVAEAGELALVELADGDTERMRELDDGAFDPDEDDRPPLHVPDVQRLGVARGDELVGTVSWHAVAYGRGLGCAAWNLGMALLPAARGRGTGAVAVRMLVEYLLATTEVDRVEASTDIENVAAQRVLMRSGFRFEGVLRGAQRRLGERRDMMQFALLRTDLVAPVADAPRTVVAERDGVALAEPLPGEREALYQQAAGDFDIDKDDRPRLAPPVKIAALTVLDPASGELLGGVSWHPVDYGGTLGCTAWNIGIALVPPARGRGVGTTAQRLLVEYLFATTPVDRIEAGTDVENVAEQKALERAGFRREGVLRGAQLRSGARHALVHYGMLRDDLRPAGERRTFAERDGIALGDVLPGELRQVMAADDGLFAVDDDRRPGPRPMAETHRAAILDANDGKLLGVTGWHVVSYGGTLGCVAWNIGITLLPAERGRGVGAIAQRLLAGHLFATTGVDRVEAGTDVDNVAERRALAKAGFREEGTIRGAQLRGGRRTDLVSYARLRTDE